MHFGLKMIAKNLVTELANYYGRVYGLSLITTREFLQKPSIGSR
jgi:predicted house-cleaning NTP pyrophosphatase (Maf/HAM1 superfamily)